MTATNHAVTGVIIASVVPNAAIGLPLALLSHFALDALPHFGKHPKLHHTSRAFLIFLSLDLAVAFSVLLAFAFTFPHNFFVPVLGGLIAMSPDAMWFPGYLRNLKGQKPKSLGPIATFHLKIQWAELPWGYVFEIAWLGLMLLTLAKVVAIW